MAHSSVRLRVSFVPSGTILESFTRKSSKAIPSCRSVERFCAFGTAGCEADLDKSMGAGRPEGAGGSAVEDAGGKSKSSFCQSKASHDSGESPASAENGDPATASGEDWQRLLEDELSGLKGSAMLRENGLWAVDVVL